MHLTAIVESPEHVCCRYRVRAFAPLFEQAGHTMDILGRPRTTTGWFRLRNHLRHSAGVILQRKLLPVWQLRLLRSQGRFLVYDFDDAIIWRHSSVHGALPSRRRQRLFAAVLRLSDAVVAGNSYLAAQARESCREDRLHIIPTCIDVARYSIAEHQRRNVGVELAWIGSSSSLQTLAGARAMLERLGAVQPGLRLKIICDQFLQAGSMPVVAFPWSEDAETTALASADIGISWLPDDPWHQGKCGLKVLQYMAAGLPVVASRVGIHAELVRHGETGFLAETTQEWIAAIERLAGDPALRQRMGHAGRQLVEKHYTIALGARCWLPILDELHSVHQRPSRKAALRRLGMLGWF